MSNFVPEKTALGIEFGSTRIKAVLIGPEHTPLAQGDYTWENQLHNGIWTYPLEQVWQGLQSAYAALAADVQQKYGCTLTKVGCIGISAMMHGYLAFNANGELLVPFRTWRNTITGAAAEELTAAFGFNIPQRWSIAHLYQAMLNKEEHLSKLDFFTTLAGYVHWQLTGHKVLGVGDASGMFPIDSTTGGYDAAMLQKFNTMAAAKGYAVDLNAWVELLAQNAELCGAKVNKGELFTKLFNLSLQGAPDCGGVIPVNYYSGEGVTHFDAGRPMLLRGPESDFSLANLMRANIYSAFATLAIGLDILNEEHVALDTLLGHGGLFKTPGVAQRYLAAAAHTAVTCTETAGEGGPYGMALLAAYRVEHADGETLANYLQNRVFAGAASTTLNPDAADEAGFATFLKEYKKALCAERTAVETM